MNIEHLLLCIFPLVLLVIMAVKVKFAGKGLFHEDFLSLEQSKILQGIAAVSIIFHHLSQYITNYGNEWKGPITIYSSMGIFFTTIFFFCSGYGLVISHKRKPDYLKSFFKKRMPSVFIPFMLSNIIYFIFVGIYFGRIGSVLEGVANFFGIVLINTNTWFLVEIMILYLAFYFIFRFIKEPKCAMTVMGIFIAILITISLLLGHDKSEYGGHWFMGEWWYNTTIFFLAGMLTAQYYEPILAFLKKRYKWLMPVSAVMFLAAFALEELIIRNFGYYQEWEGHPGYGAKAITLLSQVVVCFVWLIMVLLILLKVKFNNKILILLSKISLELYIIHEIFKVHFTFSKYAKNDINIFVLVLLSSILAAIVLKLIHKYLIELLDQRLKPVSPEEMTLERKLKEKARKKRNIKLGIYGSIIIIVISVLGIREFYTKNVLPIKYYKEEIAMLADAKIGDEILFGTFDTDSTNYMDERITWYVIDKKDDMVLLISTHVLAPRYYHNGQKGTTWADSNLRKILNEDFLEYAFSKYEQELIVTSEVETQDNVQFGTAGGEITNDKIFILSAEEAELYLSDEGGIKATNVAKMAGVNVDAGNGINNSEKDFNTWWWLRTMGETEKKAAVIDTQGKVDYTGRYVTTGSGGVRPAMWVRCE